MTSCLLPRTINPFQMGYTFNGKNLLLEEQILYLFMEKQILYFKSSAALRRRKGRIACLTTPYLLHK